MEPPRSYAEAVKLPRSLLKVQAHALDYRALANAGSPHAATARNRLARTLCPAGVEILALVVACRAYRDSRTADHFDQKEIDLLNALAALEHRLAKQA